MTALEFSELRYGMFVHYGLFSRLARGEWVMNREQIPPEEMRRLAQEFDPSAFDADAICRLAVEGGMKYIDAKIDGTTIIIIDVEHMTAKGLAK